MIRIGLVFALCQFAVSFKACSGAPSAGSLRGAATAARVVAAQPNSPAGSGGAVDGHGADWARQQQEARQRFATMSPLGLVPPPSPPVAAPRAASTVQVNVDLRPPEMRNGGPRGTLDPAPLRIKIDGVTRGQGRAGDVIDYDLSPGSHTVAITNDQDVLIAERVIDAVLGKDVTVVFSE